MDDCRGLLRSDVAVLEAKTPDGDDRLVAVENIGRASGEAQVAGQVRPSALMTPSAAAPFIPEISYMTKKPRRFASAAARALRKTVSRCDLTAGRATSR